jgi:biopolymer transport protein ExbD
MKLSAHKRNREKKFALNMTPMIDVTFNLLIFFMVTMGFVKTERNLDSGIKVQRSTARSTSDLEVAVVQVIKSESSGAFVFKLGGREIAEASELQSLLNQFENKQSGAFVQVSDEAPYGKAAEALQACKSANFPIVSYVPLSQAP